MTENAKKLFIKSNRSKTSLYISRKGADFTTAAAIMSKYNPLGAEAIEKMTLIGCKSNPEAYSLYVMTRGCSNYLLDPANTSEVIADGKLTPLGESLYTLFEQGLAEISSGPESPATQHRMMQLDFIKQELAKRME